MQSEWASESEPGNYGTAPVELADNMETSMETSLDASMSPKDADASMSPGRGSAAVSSDNTGYAQHGMYYRPFQGKITDQIESETDTTTTDEDAIKREEPAGEATPEETKRRRKKYRKTKRKIKCYMFKDPDTLRNAEYYPIFHMSEKRHRTFALFNNFMTYDEIIRIHNACNHSSVQKIEDRSNSLTYKHVAFRTEFQIRKLIPDLYDRFINAVRWTDREIWKKLPKVTYPEFEYILYDRLLHDGKPGYIEEHVDNKSAVTFVLMMSDSREYRGGVNYFQRSGKHGVPRCVQLQQGDMVVFRGERLLHWISPVTDGRRIIFQGEFSRV